MPLIEEISRFTLRRQADRSLEMTGPLYYKGRRIKPNALQDFSYAVNGGLTVGGREIRDRSKNVVLSQIYNVWLNI